jgi:hypothetical protein
VLTGEPGRVWIGGVLVTTMPGFLAVARPMFQASFDDPFCTYQVR